MPGRNNFLAGLGAGTLATLVAATLLLPARRRSPRSREDRSSLAEHSLAGVNRRDAIGPPGEGGFDRQSNPKPGSTRPAVEHQGQTHGDSKPGGSKVSLPGDPHADTPMPIVHPGTKPAWYRRFKATDWIFAAVATVLTVALMSFGIAFQKQMKNVTAQLIQSQTTMRAMEEVVQTDQRPWVGLTDAVVQPLTANGGGFTIKLQNTGKTPALDLQIADVITMEDTDQSAPLQGPNISARNAAGTLMPGAVYTTDVWFNTSPDAVSNLTHDQLRAVNYIHITYKDVFQRPHSTKVCF